MPAAIRPGRRLLGAEFEVEGGEAELLVADEAAGQPADEVGDASHLQLVVDLQVLIGEPVPDRRH